MTLKPKYRFGQFSRPTHGKYEIDVRSFFVGYFLLYKIGLIRFSSIPSHFSRICNFITKKLNFTLKDMNACKNIVSRTKKRV